MTANQRKKRSDKIQNAIAPKLQKLGPIYTNQTVEYIMSLGNYNDYVARSEFNKAIKHLVKKGWAKKLHRGLYWIHANEFTESISR